MKQDFTFDGFEPANTTPVPDVLFDELLSVLTGAELKVLLYIIRRTAGFKKPTDAISLTQFEKGIMTKAGKILDKGTGLSRESASNALQSLEAMGCIESQKRTGAKNSKEVSIFRIRFKVVGKSDQGIEGQSEKTTTLVGKDDYPSRKIPLEVVGKSDIQETVQDTDKQETGEQEDTGAFAPPARAEISSLQEKISDTAARLKAIGRTEQPAAPDGWQASPVADDELDPEATVKVPAIRVTPAQPVRGASEPSVSLSGGAAALPPSAGTFPPRASTQGEPRASGARFHVPARPQRQQHERPKMEKPQLTLEGNNARAWWEEVTGTHVTNRASSVKDLNDLGAHPDLTRESMEATYKHVKTKARKYDIAVSLSIFSGSNERFRFLSFEENWLAVKEQLDAAKRAQEPTPGLDRRKETQAELRRRYDAARAASGGGR